MVDIRPLVLSEIDVVASVLGLARLYQGDGFYLVAWGGDEPLGHVHLALTDPPELQDVYVRVRASTPRRCVPRSSAVQRAKHMPAALIE